MDVVMDLFAISEVCAALRVGTGSAADRTNRYAGILRT
jgi:hypothetical protein